MFGGLGARWGRNNRLADFFNCIWCYFALTIDLICILSAGEIIIVEGLLEIDRSHRIALTFHIVRWADPWLFMLHIIIIEYIAAARSAAII